jgi:4-amino-4-deoxy-L-arabinose transferase-like glycosyltransferase
VPGPRAVAALRAAAPPVVALVAVAIVLAVRACAVAPPGTGLARGAPAAGDPPGAVVREGSVYLARGGPYRFGVQTSGPAKLVVAGRVVNAPGPRRGPRGCSPSPDLACMGVALERFVLAPGAVAIRLAGPADARLVWNPIGRRGDPEYLPASSLSPDPPERARFDPARAGTAIGDGVAALAIGAILLGLVAWTLRRRWRGAPRRLVLAVVAVGLAAAAVRLVDLGGAGQTWDEDTNWGAGRNYVSNVLAIDASPRAWIWNYEHPPVMKYLAGTGAQLADGFGPARAISALVGAAACALLVLVGARVYALRVGALAGALAALSPPLVAHAKVVGHESPSVLLWMLGLWLALTAHDALPGEAAPPAERDAARRLAWRMAGLGVVLGLAIASRFVNVLLAGAIGGILVVGAPPGTRRRTVGLGFAVIPIVAVVVAIAVWPRLWSAPLAHLAEAWGRLDKLHSPEPFLGAMTQRPPATYFLVYLAATAPVGILAGVLAWLARVGARIRGDAAERRAAALVAIAFAAPLVAMFSPVKQDGVRYVLPCVAVLALVAAAGVDFVAATLRRRGAFATLGSAVVVYLAITCARIHPYYLDYYNELVGGPAGAAASKSFETAWWGEGVDRAVDYVNAHAAPNAVVHRDCIEPAHLAWFRGDLWTPMTPDPTKAEWIVAYQPAVRRCPVPPDAKAVFTVDAQGAPLAIVYRRPAPPAAPPAP